MMNAMRELETNALELISDEQGVRAIFHGEVRVRSVQEIDDALATIDPRQPLIVDLERAERIDTAAAWAILRAQKRIEGAGGVVEITGAGEAAAQILEAVRRAMPVAVEGHAREGWLRAAVADVGQAMVGLGAALASFSGVLGLFVVRLAQSAARPRLFRFTALARHCEEVGLRATPIVALMGFLIGVVLAFQGSAQLRQFGAEVFVVDLIAISILRELGVLLTAIIVAGRTASAFTATIGSMKMREEIDAMRTLGIDPGHALVAPRIVALVLMLPVLVLIANVSGLFGGALMSWIELDISPAMFATRLSEGVDVSHALVGLIKAPVFAVLIGVIGCAAGLGVGDTAESLGRMTSSAVVAAIFAVILADALFSIFFQQIGV
jgi:phospholipid/cholesterol/gamma-HCH transport system permease protein